MGICYPKYWLQGDVEDNFYRHLEMIKSHYCTKQCLEPIIILKANSSLEVAKVCPSILVVGVLDMQFNIFYPFLMKSRLRNCLNEHLHIVVGMYSQTFYTLNTFPYDAYFDNWKDQKPMRALN